MLADPIVLCRNHSVNTVPWPSLADVVRHDITVLGQPREVDRPSPYSTLQTGITRDFNTAHALGLALPPLPEHSAAPHSRQSMSQHSQQQSWLLQKHPAGPGGPGPANGSASTAGQPPQSGLSQGQPGQGAPLSGMAGAAMAGAPLPDCGSVGSLVSPLLLEAAAAAAQQQQHTGGVPSGAAMRRVLPYAPPPSALLPAASSGTGVTGVLSTEATSPLSQSYEPPLGAGTTIVPMSSVSLPQVCGWCRAAGGSMCMCVCGCLQLLACVSGGLAATPRDQAVGRMKSSHGAALRGA